MTIPLVEPTGNSLCQETFEWTVMTCQDFPPVDIYGRTCADLSYRFYEGYCGDSDGDSFEATRDCCACGGGERAPLSTVSHSFEEVSGTSLTLKQDAIPGFYSFAVSVFYSNYANMVGAGDIRMFTMRIEPSSAC